MERRLAAILAADMVGYSRLMAEDELDELAADIKTNGLQQPIVLADFADEESGEIVTMLVDGRNRLEACKRAKVKPKTVELASNQEPTAFVLSANIHRRHLNSSQRAMATGMMYPKKGRDQTPTQLEFHSEYLRQARTVLEQSEADAQRVLAGTFALPDAYKEAKTKCAIDGYSPKKL